MRLPDPAMRALQQIRSQGKGMRFEIKKACEQERWRLKLCYEETGGREVQLGLLWSEDQAGLEELKRSLEEEYRCG